MSSITEIILAKTDEEREAARSALARRNAENPTDAQVIAGYVATLVPQSPLRVEWERDVIDAVAEVCDCDNSDAQAIVEGQGAILESCWLLCNTASDTAAQIAAGSAV